MYCDKLNFPHILVEGIVSQFMLLLDLMHDLSTMHMMFYAKAQSYDVSLSEEPCCHNLHSR